MRPLSNDDTSSQAGPLLPGLGGASDLIVKRAKDLVKRLIEQRGREEPPFFAEEFARLQGIKRIEKTDLGQLDALLLRLHDGYIIKINQNHPPVRQNFSCAHEISHILLDELAQHPPMGNAEFRTLTPNIGEKDKERLCHAAAAELLMPESIFSKYLSRFGASVSSIEWLAHTFKVSIPAAAIRIAEVSEKPCIAIRWKRWQRARSKGFWLDWCVGPGRKPGDRGYYILENRYVRDPSSLLTAYESNSPVRSFKSFQLGNFKKRCYVESKGFGYDNTRHVISLVFPDR